MKRNATELYETMARAIAYLREHAKERPSAEEVAKAVGMSTSRFEHAFAEWVGTTPKRFLSYLTKERAKALLAESHDAHRTAHRTGLSGANRLHDLLVTYEAVTPGELRSGNVAITYGLHPSPFGWCLIGVTKRGIAQLSFLDEESERQAEKDIREKWPNATIARDDAATGKYAVQIFDAKSKKPVHLLVKGTNFQIKVWEALMRIPDGSVASYADIAEFVGAPKAVRAVGTACGRNAISYLIPCHRVLASDGGFGGYRWGVQRKEAMLAWEGARSGK